MRIIVIGAGIAGLTTAIALRKAGVDTQVYEQAPRLTEVGAGIAIAANAQRALEVLALASDLHSQSSSGVRGELRRPNGSVLVAIPTDELGLSVIHRADLLALLAQHLDPERLHLARTCIGFDQDSHGVTARFQTGETAQGDGLIGADGLWSTIRTQVFGNQSVRYAGYTAWRSVVEFNESKLTVGETWGRGRRFGIVPMTRGRVYWFATNNVPKEQRDPEGRTKDMLLGLFRGWHKPIQELITSAEEGSIVRSDIYELNPLPRFVRGLVGLLGDAAHAMTPNLGQGACQAIEDAIVLAACLKRHH